MAPELRDQTFEETQQHGAHNPGGKRGDLIAVYRVANREEHLVREDLCVGTREKREDMEKVEGDVWERCEKV